MNVSDQLSSARPLHGFILSREWRDGLQGSHMELWAATDHGPAQLILENLEPVMFLRRSDLEAAKRSLPASARAGDVSLKALDGEDVEALYFPSRRLLEQARDRLLSEGVECLEADVPPGERFLMERFIRGSFRAEGTFERGDLFLRLLNPRLSHADYDPHLGVCSFDIETSEDARELYSIAYIHGQRRRVLMRGEATAPAGEADFETVGCADERGLLERFVDDVQSLDPDVLIGWNVINFDLSVLQRRCKELGVAFEIGRSRTPGRVLEGRAGTLNAIARCPGRVILDGIECLRSAFWRFQNYSLESVGRELLGRGKTISAEHHKPSEITRLFHEDKAALARYNIEDCRLVLDVFAATDLLNFVVQRTRLTGLAMGRQGGSVAAFDYLYLPRLHREGWVAPSLLRQSDPQGSPGGYVLDSVPGIHDNVAVLDFKSLYPSIIRTFRIDPLGRAQPGDDPVPGFLGARFSREHSLLPTIIEELWQRRDDAKRAGNQPLSQAIKILMNSFYGVLGTDACRFYHPQLASSITRRGHEIIQTSRDWIEQQGFRVIYGDTDSLFVLLRETGQASKARALELVANLNRWWQARIRSEYRLHSYLEIELETLFNRFFMPTIRGGEVGSKKRYAGITEAGGGSLVIKGLEAVRSDWTELARSFQRELLYAVLQGQDAEHLTRRYVDLVRSGGAESQLVYHKRLRRPLNAYRKTIPPHVRAARQLGKPVSEVRYYITVAGPQPVERRTASLDYDHYVERQIKPVADAVLPFVGLDFDRIVGGQRDLFS